MPMARNGLSTPDISSKKGLTFIIGTSRLGAGLAAEFNNANISVIVIDKDPLAFNRLPDNYSGFQIRGDALDPSFLEHNGIRDAKRVIIVTNDDNVNILVSYICHFVFKIKDVYVRLNDNVKSELITGTGIRAFYPYLNSKNSLLAMIGEEKQ